MKLSLPVADVRMLNVDGRESVRHLRGLKTALALAGIATPGGLAHSRVLCSSCSAVSCGRRPVRVRVTRKR